MATVTAKQIANHIEAVTVVLNGVDEHEEMHAGVVKAQGGQLETLIRGSSLDMQGIALVVQAIQESSFPLDLQDSLMNAVTSLAAVGLDSKKRRQSWESLLNGFLPVSLEAKLRSPDFMPALMCWLLFVGLRKGSEATFQTITIAALAGAEGLEKTQNFTEESRSSMNESMKKWWRRLVKNAPEPQIMLWELPNTPDELKEQLPQVYEDWYGVDPPSSILKDLVPPLYETMLRDGTRMRRDKSKQFSAPRASNMLPQLMDQESPAAGHDDGAHQRQLNYGVRRQAKPPLALPPVPCGVGLPPQRPYRRQNQMMPALLDGHADMRERQLAQREEEVLELERSLRVRAQQEELTKRRDALAIADKDKANILAPPQKKTAEEIEADLDAAMGAKEVRQKEAAKKKKLKKKKKAAAAEEEGEKVESETLPIKRRRIMTKSKDVYGGVVLVSKSGDTPAGLSKGGGKVAVVNTKGGGSVAGVSKGGGKVAAVSKGSDKTHLKHESSRKQFLAMVAGQPCKVFKYGDGDEEAASHAGMKHIRDALERLGRLVPEKSK